METLLPTTPPVLVMGVGNLLKGDDGFGEEVLGRLESEDLPDSVELLAAGTSIIDLMGALEGRRKLIVIDAVRGGNPAGTLYRFAPEEVDYATLPTDSLHQLGLVETLRLGDLVGCRPEKTLLIGVEPADTSLGIGLSEAVENAVPRAVRLVKEEINLP